VSLRELVVLGTASQVPTRYRNHNGYLLLWDGRGLLFDPGEGTQRQMLLAGVSATQLTRILITHFHGDHCLGLAGIVQRVSLDGVPHTIDVHYPASGQVYFDRLRHASIFKDQARVRAVPAASEGTIHADDVLTVTARQLDHGPDTLGYRIEEPGGWRLLPDRLEAEALRGPAIAELVRDGTVAGPRGPVRIEDVAERRLGQKVAFVMDTRMCDAALALAEGVDLLICESTFLSTESDEAHAYGHLTAAQAGTIAREAGVRRLVLTHFSQRYRSDQPFVDEARAMCPDVDVVPARDLDRIPVPSRRAPPS